MSIVENKERFGKFTSSKIHLLAAKGKGHEFSVLAQTYIDQKRHERKLGRSIDMGRTSQSATWGLFLEKYVYSKLGFEYGMEAAETKINPKIPYHAGSADLIQARIKVGDIKCFEPTKFCKIVECFDKKDLSAFKKEFKAEYWQLVSNAMIHDVPRAESLVYMPTEAELEEIKEMAMDYQGDEPWKYRFIYESKNHELPYIPNGSEYSSLNTFEFEVRQEDIEFLTERLRLAEEHLLSLSV